MQKKRKHIETGELSSVLRELADDIENRNLKIGSRVIELPDTVELKLKYRRKEHENKLTIKIVWPEIATRQAVEEGSDSIKKTNIPKKLKDIKKLMEVSLRSIEKSLDAGNSTDADLAVFLETLKDFKRRSKPEWHMGINELGSFASKLELSLKNDPDSASCWIKEIRENKKKYHDRFK